MENLAVANFVGMRRQVFHPSGMSNGLHLFGPGTPRITPGGLSTIFAQESDRYYPDIAYLLAIVSTWAYSDGQTLSNELRYYGFPSNTVTSIAIENEALGLVSTAFFIRSHDGRAGILAFRGTEPTRLMNWVGDADAKLREFFHGKVHRGFHTGVEALWGEIDQAISVALEGTDTNGNGSDPDGRGPLEVLYITGHSLGGALALLAAARIFATDEKRYAPWRKILRGVYTYGQPMVGNQEFVDYYEASPLGRMLYRHIYRRDIVPRLPSKTMGDFAHVGQEWLVKTLGGSWERSTAHEGKTKQLWLWTPAVAIAAANYAAQRTVGLRMLQFRWSVEDHSPAGYIDACRQAL